MGNPRASNPLYETLLKVVVSIMVAYPLHFHFHFHTTRNGEPLHIYFDDVYGPVIPAISFCRNKSLTLHFPPFPAISSPELILSPTARQQNGGSPVGYAVNKEGRSCPIPTPDTTY